jgi:hypothetical protein
LYIFVGPTLQPQEIADMCDAVCLPPVKQGDVYRVALTKPQAIGIIDGYFSGVPSVWHKEILWALSQGIHVFGSASMGALRAAELHRFGMRGVGRIFEAFRDGLLEDDDEVAVVHAPLELGFAAASEPMVNIRATLARAEREQVLRATACRELEEFAKSLYFPDRNWPALINAASAHGLTVDERANLGDWLPGGRVDQKREDALEMLAAMQATATQPLRPPDFRFEWTNFWDEFVARAAPPQSGAEPLLAPSYRGVVEELRLQGEEIYVRVRQAALLRALAEREARRQGFDASPEAKSERLNHLRTALGLYSRNMLESWLLRNELAASSLEQLVENDVLAEAVLGKSGSLPDRYLLDELRLSGAFEGLAERARRKREVLAARTTEAAADGDALDLPPFALRLWFFEKRLGRPLPDDLNVLVDRLGFANLNDFDDALRREWVYLVKDN